MGMLKKVYRKLLDRELGVLGGELERAEDALEQRRIQLEALQLRFERLQNRVGMRLARIRPEEEVDARDDQRTLRELQRGHFPEEDFFRG